MALRELPPGTDDPALRADVERLAAAANTYSELAGTYEAALTRGLEPAGRREVLRQLAGLYADRLDRPQEAARALEALTAEAPDPEALAALARLYRGLGAPRELCGVLQRLAGVASSPVAKKELLLEVATVMEEQLSDRDGAIDTYRQILAVDPEDPNALRLLARLLGAAERWEELVGVMGREVAIAERSPGLAAEAAELRFRLGRIRQTRLADALGALEDYRAVLERVPRHPATLAALEEMAKSGASGAAEAAALLEPIYLQEGEHAKLIEALEARAVAQTDPALRAPVLRRIAEVQASALRNVEAAFLTAARAVREDPDQAESIALAGRLAEGSGLTEELAALLAEVADRPRSPAARLELRRNVAHLTARGNDTARAQEAWRRVLELAPDDAEALSGLAAALRGAGDADALAQALRRRIAIEEDPAQRTALLAELAQLQEEQLQDAPGAITTLRRLLELAPDRRDALDRMDRLCVATERWAELSDVLAREIAAANGAGDAAAVATFRQRLAELKERRLLDREGALALYEEILAVRPDDAPALGRLEAFLAKDPTNVRAAAVLEKAYAATGAWGNYATVLEVRATERPDPVERKALFVELAEVREKRLGNHDLAFVALCRAFRDDPGDAALRGELQRLADATGHAEELAALYEEEFEKLPASAGAEVALTVGAIHDQKLHDPEGAIRWYERARRLEPSAAPKALGALDRLYSATGNAHGLADVLESAAGITSGEQRATFLFRLGQLSEERLKDTARAARTYEALLAEQPHHVASLGALERIYEAAGQQDRLAGVLATQREAASDDASKLRISARLAATTQALGRDDEAIDLWRQVVSLDQRHEVALAALETLYEKAERWKDLAEHLRVRLALTTDRREAARLQEKLGGLLTSRLNDSSQAVRAYQAVLDADPRNRKALESLRDLYSAQSDLEGLASVYRRLIPLQEDAAGVKAVRMQLADVLLRAGKKGEAAEQGRRALELEPHDDAELARIAAIFEGAGAPQERVKAIEARAALLQSTGREAEAIEAWIAAADAWEKPLGKPEAAAAALESVLEIEPDRRESWIRLKDLHARSGNWRNYVRVCDLFTTHLQDKGERIAVLKELGEIHEKRLGQREMAFVTYCRAFAEDPADPAANAAVQRLAAETEAWDELAAVYEQVSEDGKGLIRAKLLLELGRLRDGKLDDPDGAETAFRRALEIDPASPEALDALTDLFTRRGRVRDLVIALEQKLEAAAGLDEKKATLLEMARIYDGQLKDPGEAISALRRVLELDGADGNAIGQLAQLYRRESRWPDLANILARARDLAHEDGARITYQLQLAALHENELEEDEAAVEDYRAVLGLDDRQRDALAGLERLYTKLDRFAELNRVYEKQAEIATDPREKVRILGKSASIWEEKLNDPRTAIERNESVLSLDGGNLPAVKNLETLYRREAEWERLIAVLQHHATLTQDRREQVSLEVQIGEVLWKELSRVDRAEAMFSHALETDPESVEAVSALARLYERSGNWNLAIEMLQREAKLPAAGAAAVEIQARIGKIQDEMLQDRGAAKLAYMRALDADPGHLPSLRALRAISEAEKNRDAYLRYLLAEARYAETDAEKAKLLHEAGRIHQEEREDPDGAMRLYEEALKKVPDFLPAARPLADLYVNRSDWPHAEAVLDVVVRRLAQDGEAKELCRQSYRLGYVAEKIDKRSKALECYRRAYELDATYLPALEGLGHLLVQDKSWEEGLKIFQTILIHHRDSLTDLEVVETYWQIGEIQAKLGQADRSTKSFEKALEIDAGHEPSRRSLIALLESTGEWDSAVEHRQKLAAQLEGQAKLEVLTAIGAISRDRLQDPYQAIDAYTSAARLDPGNVQITEALLGLYRETRQAQKAADVLARLIESPEAKQDGQKAARLHHALALLLRDELKDEAGAARELEAALDADPKLVQAFADLEALLTQGSKWRDLEGAYVRMIQRLPKGPEAATPRAALWKTLGELYRRVLNDPENARMAFEVVAKTNPDDAGAIATYAELAAKLKGHEAEAVNGYRRLIAIGDAPQKAVSALVGLHAELKSFDQAYSAAQVLAFLLGSATPEEQQVVTRLRRFARDTASTALDDALWGQLVHERIRGPMAEILVLLGKEASDVFMQQPKDLELNPKKHEVDVQTSMLFFVNMVKYVARTLGFQVPRLFRPQEEGSSRLQLLPLLPPALIAGEELFQERPKKELWFTLGKAMAFLRPELTLARHMPHDQLDAVFQAAVSLGTSRFVVSADPHLVEKLKRRLEKTLPEQTRTQKLKLLARAYCDVQRPGDMRTYLDAAELTSNRAGALLAGDLEVVRRRVGAEKPAVSKLKEETRLRDLVLFCTSEEYATLRERLKLSVVVPNS
jgi:tetratricopeptide (TPR) repeat protein